MKFTLMILAAPYTHQGAESALRFARAVLAEGHELYRVFFYGDGVHCASTLIRPPQDEVDIPQTWRQLIRAHQLDAVACIAAAARRGLHDAEQAQRLELDCANIDDVFRVGGLGELIEACQHSDRVLTFGP